MPMVVRQIQPRECLNQCWNKDKANAPNILALIDRFNAVSVNSDYRLVSPMCLIRVFVVVSQLSGYIKLEILKTQDIKQRVKAIEYFLQVRELSRTAIRPMPQKDGVGAIIQVAKHCEEVRNFNALMEIVSSLNATPLYRLRQTWKMVGGKYKEWKETWTQLTHTNYSRHLRPASFFSPFRLFSLCDDLACHPPGRAGCARLTHKQHNLVYLTLGCSFQILPSLSTICLPSSPKCLLMRETGREGNKDFLVVEDTLLINFEKRKKIASVISHLQQVSILTGPTPPSLLVDSRLGRSCDLN